VAKALAAAQGKIRLIKMEARQPVHDVSTDFQ
jgi:hypothetical protein